MGVVRMSGDAELGGGDGDEYAEIVNPETPDDAVRRWGWDERLAKSVVVRKRRIPDPTPGISYEKLTWLRCSRGCDCPSFTLIYVSTTRFGSASD